MAYQTSFMVQAAAHLLNHTLPQPVPELVLVHGWVPFLLVQVGRDKVVDFLPQILIGWLKNIKMTPVQQLKYLQTAPCQSPSQCIYCHTQTALLSVLPSFRSPNKDNPVFPENTTGNCTERSVCCYNNLNSWVDWG